jgi:hypothetical protein
MIELLILLYQSSSDVQLSSKLQALMSGVLALYAAVDKQFAITSTVTSLVDGVYRTAAASTARYDILVLLRHL